MLGVATPYEPKFNSRMKTSRLRMSHDYLILLRCLSSQKVWLLTEVESKEQ
jgi:hypothetical protein